MSGFRLWLIAVTVLSGVLYGFRPDGKDWAAQTRAEPGEAEYAPRLVKNVKVRNYNVVGENNVLYDRAPRRAIAVGENINETLVALGAGDRIICSVRYGNPLYRPEPENAEGYARLDFQDGFRLNVETALFLSPDFIVSGQSLFTEKRMRDTDFWQRRGVNTFFPLNANSPYDREHRESLENEFAFILGLGRIFDEEEKAERFVRETRALIERVRAATKNRRPPKAMIVEGLGRNLVAYDSSKLVGDICVRLGAQVPESPVAAIGLEYLLEENPDVLFVVKSGGDAEAAARAVAGMPALSSLKCVREGRVYGIMLNYTYNSAIKTKAGVRLIARGLYPDLRLDEAQ